MADGSIKISIEVDGKQVDVAAKQLDNLEASGNRSGKGIKAAESSLDSLSDKSAKAGTSVKGAGDTIEGLGSSGDSAAKGLQGVDGAMDGVADSSAQASDSVRGMSDTMADVDNKSNQASGSVKTFVASVGLVAIATAAFNTMRQSMDQAISRFDTLNAFPKVLQALGVSAEDSDAAMAKLSDGIDGLPTKLNDITGSAQRMYTSFNDMDKATDTAIALNNALLGSGSSAEEAKRGTDQYIKALQTGEINMDTWNTLSETMDVGLIKIAEGFGFAGKSAKDDLYNALQDGTITLDQFNDKLIEVGTGTGIMADLAKENSLGIATSLTNLKNSIANGVAGMIESFNKLSEEVTGKEIAEHIDSAKVVINAAFNAMKSVIESTTPIFKFFGSVIGEVISELRPFAPVIIGAASAFSALLVVQKVAGMILAFGTALKTSAAATKTVELATKAYYTALRIYTGQLTLATVAERTRALATAAGTKVLAASTLAFNLLTGKIKLATAAKIAFAAASRALNVAMGLLSGPIGWVTVGIGALVGAVVGVVKWFNRASEDGERLKGEIEKMDKETTSLTDSVDSSANAYKEAVSSINANADASSDLLKTVDELSQKENKSEEDKQKLKNAVDQLNGSVEGLNLMYNEEADSLSESSELIQARIDLMRDQETAQAAQERYTEILQDQHTVEEQLNEVLDKQKEVQSDNNLTKKEASDMSSDLTDQEEILRAKLEELADEQVITEEAMVAAQESIKQAVQDGNAAMLLSYDDLKEHQQAAFDQMADKYDELKDAATDAFDKINDESEVSAQEMIENLQHNQEMVAAWGENHAELMAYASENGYTGFMQWLDGLGIDSAAELQTVADMSDEQLQKFAELMDEGGSTAANSMKDSLGEGLGEVGDILVSMVEQGAMTTAEAIEAANFYELFGVLPEQGAEGIEDGSEKVETASRGLAEKSWTAFNLAMGNYDFFNEGHEVPIDISQGMGTGSSYVELASRTLGRGAVDPMANEINGSDVEGTGSSVPTRLSGSLNNGKDSVTNAASELGQAPENAISSEINQSTFETYGSYVTMGLTQGINSGSGDVSAAGTAMTGTLLEKVRSQLGIHSPSTVFRAFGDFIVQGLVGGITNGQSSVVNSIVAMTTSMLNRTQSGMQGLDRATQAGIANMGRRLGRLPAIASSNMRGMQNNLSSGAATNAGIMTRLAVNMVTPFSSIRGRMSAIGSFAMSGLQAGLNGGAGRVMSTARSIASRVASTMKNALKIKSPSRVMRDDVGKWIPAGIAVGIEDNAKLVYKALDDMSTGMIKPVSPEIALGTSKMAYNGSDSMTQAVKNIKFPENKQDGSVTGLLREQNSILNRLLNKDTNAYIDGEKLTKVVNENNAIIASLSVF
ncbi:tape measure protein [Oceanobacillus sp. J11TS1]|uniref:tape measure protein n=1 Tax=Oceanobacillus sp. J11TS1 TaxID=2807191 RepID=UPI001B1EBD70|nr:tape measure protein [Oceanobacillus sp. J11TS1]GIO25162.1 hypothetical protein J11TS1_37430 [Oceanobacillus sp. J11TS1]